MPTCCKRRRAGIITFGQIVHTLHASIRFAHHIIYRGEHWGQDLKSDLKIKVVTNVRERCHLLATSKELAAATRTKPMKLPRHGIKTRPLLQHARSLTMANGPVICL
eukprot:TRINITY_DN9944_c1_g1_i1.p1 TRINITY_DN9944_c1_g1~~TRINITY_DN9944_c1_g1_i1.p1  ORF type:complete len:107 (+),score=3.40 TRINITY_DN9944_c1_g1_i1:182-502(+)